MGYFMIFPIFKDWGFEGDRAGSRLNRAQESRGVGAKENGLGFPLIAPQLLPATQERAGFGDRFYFSAATGVGALTWLKARFSFEYALYHMSYFRSPTM